MESGFASSYNVDQSFRFGLPTTLLYGVDVVDRELCAELAARESRAVALITDSGVRDAGVLDHVSSVLSTGGCTFEVYVKDRAEPTDQMAAEASAASAVRDCDTLLALGGGGVMDLAKVLRLDGADKADVIRGCEGWHDALPTNGKRLVAVPTTSGTGSESGSGAVLIHDTRREKFCVVSPSIAPDLALVDPTLTLSLPPDITAYTGFDVLGHAMGAYFSAWSQPATDPLALEAVRLASANLRMAVGRGSNVEARTNLSLASMIAGIAMNHADVTVEHILAETLGPYYEIPHGMAVAQALAVSLEHNWITAPSKVLQLARAFGSPRTRAPAVAAEWLAAAVRCLARDLAIPMARSVGAKVDDLAELTERALRHPNIEAGTNPRPLDRGTLSALIGAVVQERFATSP
jgi:alcohol dehydrogenase class IV